MIKRISIRLLLVLLGVVVAFALTEGALRLLNPRMVGSLQGLYVLSQDLGHKMKPNMDVQFSTPEYTTRVHSNSLGFRDQDHAPEPAPETSRVLVLGDSMVEALQVPLEQTFHQLLEASLNEWAKGQSRYEVISMGVGGFGLLQEYATWRQYGRQLKPDLVILVSHSNDFESELVGLKYPLSDRQLDERVQARASVLHGTAVERFYRSFHTYFLLRNVLWQLPGGKAFFDWGRGVLLTVLGKKAPASALEQTPGSIEDKQPGPDPRVWEAFIQTIDHLEEEVVASGANFLVSLAPDAEQVELERLGKVSNSLGLGQSPPQPDQTDRLLAQALQSKGVDFVPLASYLRQNRDSEQPLYWKYDRHWTAEGHRIVAEAISLRVINSLELVSLNK